MPTGGQTRRPAHAGQLPRSERLTIGLVLLSMAGLVTAIVLSAGPPQRQSRPSAEPPHSPAAPASVGGAWSGPGAWADAAGVVPVPAAAEDQRLAAALAPVLRGHRGSFAAGVVDGQVGAVYNGERPLPAAGVVRADILAALLLQHQGSHEILSEQQRDLAAEMIEHGNGHAAAALWAAIGRARGLSAANRLLHLDHTRPVKAWQLTTTTVDDQLRLLADLTRSSSPLSRTSRSYELGLMRRVGPGQRWGISAAAAPRSSPAVCGGWFTGERGTWVINSMGVIVHGGHQILVAVLSEGQPAWSAGMDQTEAAARAAVSAIAGGGASTRTHPGAGLRKDLTSERRGRVTPPPPLSG